MNQDEQEIQVSTAEQSSEYEAVPTGQDGKRKKQKKKKFVLTNIDCFVTMNHGDCVSSHVMLLWLSR